MVATRSKTATASASKPRGKSIKPNQSIKLEATNSPEPETTKPKPAAHKRKPAAPKRTLAAVKPKLAAPKREPAIQEPKLVAVTSKVKRTASTPKKAVSTHKSPPLVTPKLETSTPKKAARKRTTRSSKPTTPTDPTASRTTRASTKSRPLITLDDLTRPPATPNSTRLNNQTIANICAARTHNLARLFHQVELYEAQVESGDPLFAAITPQSSRAALAERKHVFQNMQEARRERLGKLTEWVDAFVAAKREAVEEKAGPLVGFAFGPGTPGWGGEVMVTDKVLKGRVAKKRGARGGPLGGRKWKGKGKGRAAPGDGSDNDDDDDDDNDDGDGDKDKGDQKVTRRMPAGTKCNPCNARPRRGCDWNNPCTQCIWKGRPNECVRPPGGLEILRRYIAMAEEAPLLFRRDAVEAAERERRAAEAAAHPPPLIDNENAPLEDDDARMQLVDAAEDYQAFQALAAYQSPYPPQPHLAPQSPPAPGPPADQASAFLGGLNYEALFNDGLPGTPEPLPDFTDGFSAALSEFQQFIAHYRPATAGEIMGQAASHAGSPAPQLPPPLPAPAPAPPNTGPCSRCFYNNRICNHGTPCAECAARFVEAENCRSTRPCGFCARNGLACDLNEPCLHCGANGRGVELCRPFGMPARGFPVGPMADGDDLPFLEDVVMG